MIKTRAGCYAEISRFNFSAYQGAGLVFGTEFLLQGFEKGHDPIQTDSIRPFERAQREIGRETHHSVYLFDRGNPGIRHESGFIDHACQDSGQDSPGLIAAYEDLEIDRFKERSNGLKGLFEGRLRLKKLYGRRGLSVGRRLKADQPSFQPAFSAQTVADPSQMRDATGPLQV